MHVDQPERGKIIPRCTNGGNDAPTPPAPTRMVDATAQISYREV